MRKILIKIILFVAIVFSVDRIAGLIFHYLYANAKGGYTERNYGIIHKSNEDILIFGSSRATHHYVPSIIEATMNMTCRNCGVDGMGIILEYGQLRIISKRYMPKVVVIDINAPFCIEKNDNTKYISYLKPEAGDKDIMNILGEVSEAERYKCMSNMYVYNSQVMKLLADNYFAKTLSVDNGYIPIYGECDNFPSVYVDYEYELDSLKLGFIERTITEYKDKTKLVLVISPVMAAVSRPKVYDALIELADKYDVALLDYSASVFSLDKRFWKDSAHLNDKGARSFTRKVVADLNKVK